MTWSNVYSEVKEVFESKSLNEFKEETSDVIYGLGCLIYDKFKIVLPMVGAGYSIDKVERRLIVWRSIFEKEGLLFDKKYLINGSNHNKCEKVKLAIDMARCEQRD